MFSAVACTLHPALWLLCAKPEVIDDGNTTVPIVGGVGGEDGGDAGVASASQNETAVQHRITVAFDELTSHEQTFGEEMSGTAISSAAHESASTTQKEDGDSTHGERFLPAFSLPAIAHVERDWFVPHIITPHRGRRFHNVRLYATISFFIVFFPIPFDVLALFFSLLPSSKSNPGSQSRLFSPLRTTALA